MPTIVDFIPPIITVNGEQLSGVWTELTISADPDEMKGTPVDVEDLCTGDDISFWTQLPQWKMAQLRNMGCKKRRRWQPVLWIIRNDSGLYSRRAVKGYK